MREKHVKAKFFLIKDYYEAGEIDVQYCHTDVMWADVLKKPFQGQSSDACVFFYKIVQGIMKTT